MIFQQPLIITFVFKTFIAQLVADKPFRVWRDNFESISRQNPRLEQPEVYESFVEMAQAYFPDSTIFKASNLTQFVVETAQELKKGGRDLGLAYAKHICKYFDLEAVRDSIHETFFDKLVGNKPQADIELELMEMAKNIGLPIKPNELNPASKKSQYLRKIFGNARKFVLDHSVCRVNTLKDDMNVKLLGLLVADGALDDEVDSENVELEGYPQEIATCFMAQVIDNSLSKSDNARYLNIPKLFHMRDDLFFVSSMFSLTKRLSCEPDSPEIMEILTIQLLRDLKINEFMSIPVGFTPHAIALSVFKKGPRLYDILVFNSGLGLNYHSRFQQGRQVKYFPAKMFNDITLSELKTLGFFKKIFEILETAMFGYLPVEDVPIRSDVSDFYEIALAVLSEYEHQFTVEDAVMFAVIPPQRSGTCSVRSVLAYMAWFYSPFRQMKLILIRDLFLEVSKRQWRPNERQTLAKLMKFGLENYARSTLKFLEKENSVDIPETLLWSDHFDKLYESYSAPFSPGRPLEFSLSNSNLTRDDGFLLNITREGISVQKDFISFAQNQKKFSLVLHVHCDSAHKGTFQSFSIAHVERMLELLDYCWTEVDNEGKLTFLVATVLYQWPRPTFEKDVYDQIFEGDVERNENILFDVVRHMVKYSASIERYHHSYLAALVKIKSIFLKGMAQVDPGVKCLSGVPSPSSIDRFSFLCPDVSVHEALDSTYTKEQIQPSENILNVGESSLVKTPLEGYLDHLVPNVNWSQYFKIDDVQKRRDAVLHSRLSTRSQSTALPPHHYFWALLQEETDRIFNLSNSKPCATASIHPEYDPLNEECTLNGIHHVPGWLLKPFPTPCHFENAYDAQHYQGTGRYPISYSSFETEIEEKQHSCFGITQLERGILANTMRTEKSDRINIYTQLMIESPDQFEWATIVHLGLQIIHHDGPKKISLQRLHNIVKVKLWLFLTDIRAKISLLQTHDDVNMKLLSTVRQFGGLVILNSALEHKLKLTGSVNIREQILSILDIDKTNQNYSTFLMLSYILSVMNGQLTVSESKNVVKMLPILNQTSCLLQKEVDRDYYMFQVKLVVAQANWKLEYEKRTNSKGLLDMFPGLTLSEFNSVNLPWIQTPRILANLINGAVFVDGILSGPVSKDLIWALLKEIKFSLPECVEFEKISKQVKDGAFRTVCELKDGHRPYVFDIKGDKMMMKEITFLTNGSAKRLMIRFTNNYQGYFISKDVIDWPKVPIPAPLDSDELYNTLHFTDRDQIVFWNSSETAWAKEGRMHFVESKICDLLPLAGGKVYSPLTSKFKGKVFSTSSDMLALLFPEYCNEQFRPLWFEANSNGKFVYQNDQQLTISNNQIFEGCNDLIHYLVLENKDGARKIVIPIEHFEVEKKKDPLNLTGANPIMDKLEKKSKGNKKRTVVISLSTSNAINPQSRYETILVAYHFLVARKYEASFNLIGRLHHMEFFTPHELQLLAWIVFGNVSNKDGSPDSIAVRSLVAFIVFKNHMLFQNLSLERSQNKEDSDPDPYEKEEFWVRYWNRQLLGEFISKTVMEYFHRIAKIPLSLRFHTESSRGLMSKFEEATWLKSLQPYEYILMYLGNEQPTFSTTDHRPPGILKNLLFESGDIQKCRHPPKYELSKKSTIKSFGFSNQEQKDFICWVVAIDLDSEQLLRYDSYLREFDSTPNEIVASVLRNALLLSPADKEEFEMILADSDTFDTEIATSLNEFLKDRVFLKPPTNNKQGYIAQGKSPKELIRYRSKEIYSHRKENGYYKKALAETVYPSKDPDLKTLLLTDLDLGVGLDLDTVKTFLRFSEFDLLMEYMRLYHTKQIVKGNLEYTKGTLPDFCDDLSCVFESLISIYETVAKSIEGRINSLINKDMEGQTVEGRLKTVGFSKRTYLRSDLLHLYAKSRSFFYEQFFPGKSFDWYQTLHNEITKLALAISNLHDLRRLLSAFKIKLEDGLNSEFLSEVSERYRSSKTTDNVVLTYEIFINSRVTRQQLDIIQKFSRKDSQGKFPDIIYELIMSAGKSFILSSILSLLKADYRHLSMMILPKSLFIKEAPNLMTRTINAFGGEGFSFRIQRTDKEHGNGNIVWIREALIRAREFGQYVIQTPEMILTMENKLVEYGIERSSHFSDMKGVLNELRKYGAATVDEVQEIFPPDKELNFPLVSLSDPNKDEIVKNQALALCEVFKILLKPAIRKQADIRKNIQVFDDQYIGLKTLLADELILKLGKREFELPVKIEYSLEMFSDASFREKLREFFTALPSKLSKENIRYIQDRFLNPETLDILAVFRLAILDWIPLAWKENVNEHYGLSDSTNYAIPYSNAGNPKVGSEFSFRWFTYVKTIRTYLVRGFNFKATCEAMVWIKDWAFSEIEMTRSVGDSIPERLLDLVFAESLSKINTEISVYIEKYNRILTDQHIQEVPFDDYITFIFLFLSMRIIPSVKFYDQQISSNAQDFDMIFKSIQGYTGTLSTYRAITKRFLDNPNLTKNEIDNTMGIGKVVNKEESTDNPKIKQDATIIPSIRDKIIKDHHDLKLKIITIPSGLNSGAVLKRLKVDETSLYLKKAPFNAIIDVGAYFKDESNESVAQSILPGRKAVLYFSTNSKSRNKLAVKTEKVPEKILHNMSREALQAAVSDAASRVTLYDDANTTGVDIYQDDRGFGYIFIGIDTTSERFYQAAMRMRKLLKEQVVLIVVPEPVRDEILKLYSTKPLTIELIIQFLHHNMSNQVRKYNGMALINMIKAIFKEAVYESMLCEELFEKKLFELWLKSSETSLLDLASPTDVQEFKSFVQNLILSIDNQLSKILPEKHKDYRQKAEILLTQVLADQYYQNYDSMILAAASNDSEQIVETEVETQTETDKLLELDIEAADGGISKFKAWLELRFKNWAVPELPVTEAVKDPAIVEFEEVDQDYDEYENKEGFVQISRILDSYDRIILKKSSDLPEIFSSRLFISKSMINMKNLFGKYRQYLFYVMLLVAKDSDELERAVVINDKEYLGLLKFITENPDKNVFGYNTNQLRVASGTGDVILYGEDKRPLNDEEMDALSEIMIFGGNLGTLEDPKWLPYFKKWIGKDRAFRSIFFSSIVLSPSEKLRLELRPLGKNLDMSPETFSSICQNSSFKLLHTFSGDHQKINILYEETLQNDIENNDLRCTVRLLGFMNFFYVSNMTRVLDTFEPILFNFLKKRLFDGSPNMKQLLDSLRLLDNNIWPNVLKFVLKMISTAPERGVLGPVVEALIEHVQIGVFRGKSAVASFEADQIRDMFNAIKKQGTVQKDPSVLLRVLSPTLVAGPADLRSIQDELLDILDMVADSSVHENLLLWMYKDAKCLTDATYEWKIGLQKYLEQRVLTNPSLFFLTQLYRIAFQLGKEAASKLEEIAPGSVELPGHLWFKEEDFFNAVVSEATLNGKDLDVLISFKSWILKVKNVKMTDKEKADFRKQLIVRISSARPQ